MVQIVVTMHTLARGEAILSCPKDANPMRLLCDLEDHQLHVCDRCETTISLSYKGGARLVAETSSRSAEGW